MRLDECEVPNRLRKWQRVDRFDPKTFPKLFVSLEARAAELRISREFQSPNTLLYDSKADSFSTWSSFSAAGNLEQITRVPDGKAEIGSLLLDIRETLGSAMGVEKALPALAGRVRIEYEVFDGHPSIPNLYYCAIPMQAKIGLIEVGTNEQDQPANATSIYRLRSFVPTTEILDGRIHSLEFTFDFRSLPTAGYSIIAARVNEGLPVASPGHIRLRRVQIFSAHKSTIKDAIANHAR